MITKIKVRSKKTFVFNERGNTNPDGFIYVNAYNLSEAKERILRATDLPVVLIDCYPLRTKNYKRYIAVPDWAV